MEGAFNGAPQAARPSSGRGSWAFGRTAAALGWGAYYDQYEPASQPSDCRTVEEFNAEVGEWLSDVRPVDPAAATRAVFALLSRHIDQGQIAKVQDTLPEPLRRLWRSLPIEETASETN